MSEPLILPLPSSTLVFGLDWLPLIGRKPHHLARRMARQHRATHMVLDKDANAAVGLVALKSARVSGKPVLYSAAQNVARLFANGTFAMLLDIGKAGCWFVAVHEGAVVARTDKLYSTVEEASAALDELRQAYPHIVVLGSPQAPACPGLDDLGAAGAPQSRLLPVSRWRVSLPLPMQGFVLALVLALLVPRLWQVWQSVRPVPAPPPTQTLHARQAWQQALDQAARDHFLHGVQGTRELFDALYELPIRLTGWVLLQAECTSVSSQWRCHARYERRDKEASNDLLLNAAPRQWSIDFLSMEVAKATWVLDIKRLALAHPALKTPRHTERYLFSALQAIRPLYTRMQFDQPQPLPVSAPQDQDGRLLERPAGLPSYLSRSVFIDGPLRSGSLLVPHTESMAWKKVVLFLNDAGAPNLRSSRVTVSLEGVLYETDTMAN